MRWPVVNGAMKTHAARVLSERTAHVTHLGLDEARCGRSKWRLDEVTNCRQCAIDPRHVGHVDLTGSQACSARSKGAKRRP